MSELLKTSARIASRAHAGERLGNLDYFRGHVLRVAKMVEGLEFGEEFQAAAFLHEVIDKGLATKQELIKQGVPETIVESVEALSRNPGVSESSHLSNVGLNDIAVVVEYANSLVNLSHWSDRLEGTRKESLRAKFRNEVDRYAVAVGSLYPIAKSVKSMGPFQANHDS